MGSSFDSKSGPTRRRLGQAPGLHFRKMDDFRNHIWEDTSFYSDEAKRRTQVIDSFTSSDDKLRAVVGTAASGVLSRIKTGSRALKLGESIGRIGRTAVSTSKVRECVGEQRVQESVTKARAKQDWTR